MSFTFPSIEVVSATFFVNDSPMFVASIYRSPNSDIMLFFDKLEEIMDYIRINKFKHFYLLGDWNVNLLDSNDAETRRLLDLMASFYAYHVITKPTRVIKTSATLIDYLWTDDIQNIEQSFILLNNITDHFPCISNFAIPGYCEKKTSNTVTIKKRSFF